MNKLKSFGTFILLLVIANMAWSQSKAQLRARIQTLEQEKSTLQSEKEDLTDQLNSVNGEKQTLSDKLNRISDIDIDDVITPDEQPSDVVVGESGWRVELNGLKYKSDLIGQLGTIWITDTNGQLQPQGAISISDYNIDPDLINPDKEIIYKKFISKGTTLQGDGGASFLKITGSFGADQFSNFSINIEGTSLIKPKFKDLKKIALEVKELFDFPGGKGVFICTGMHVVRYRSVIFSKSEGDAQITSPVVNIGGDFYAESSEESSEYLVVRQLTQLLKPSKTKEDKIEENIASVAKLTSDTKVQKEAKKYSPQEILVYFLKREPTFEEITDFQADPNKFLGQLNLLNQLSQNEKTIVEETDKKLFELPKEVKSEGEDDQEGN